MYADCEVTVMQACGLSEWQILAYGLIYSVIIVVAVSLLVMWIGPLMIRCQEKALNVQAEQLLLQTIVPGRFQSLHDGQQVVYVQSLSRNRKVLQDIFVAELQKRNNSDKDDAEDKDASPLQWSLITARNAYSQVDKSANKHYIVAVNGYRYNGNPGSDDYDVMQYRNAVMEMPDKPANYSLMIKSIPMRDIYRYKYKDLGYVAEWQWRLSMPFSVIILVLLATPLARVKPRQGKFSRILPAALLYIFYANMLFVARDWVQNGVVPPALGMLSVHIPMLILALCLLPSEAEWKQLRAWLRRKVAV
jgi:lipopolysaccharide export system permease protein